MKKIVQREEKVLRKIAKEVPIKEITSFKIKKIIKEMQSALKTQKDGVALAAPQIGYSLQIFIISGKIFHKDFLRGQILLKDAKIPKDLIFINPKISKLSREKEWTPEGCLSVRWAYGEVYRSKKATVTAYDEHGKKFTRGASGLLAQAFQHETDHLNGVLFIDKAQNVKEENI
ncbi:MAG: peptide deformylase [Patescibacteria group bacterium]